MIVAATVSVAVAYTIFSTSERVQDKVKTVSEHIIDNAIPKIEKAMKNGKYKSITVKADKEMERHIQSKIQQHLPLSYQTLTSDSDSVIFIFHINMPSHLVKQIPDQEIDKEIDKETEQSTAQETEQEQKEKVSPVFDFEIYPEPRRILADEFSLLEEKAQAYIKENRLSTPKGNCAMSVVEQIEDQGGDSSALRTQIGNRYLVLAKFWFKKGDRKRGNIYVDNAVIVSKDLAQSAEKMKVYYAYNELGKQRPVPTTKSTTTKFDDKINGFF